MKRFMRGASVCAVAAILAGCAATGVMVTDDQIAQFKTGESTEPQVIAALGQPSMRMRLADSSTMLVYTYSQYSTRPATFIPIVGAFAGGSDYKTNSVTLMFDTTGKLKSTTSSQSAGGVGMGASSGLTAPVDTQQPRKPAEQ